MLKYDEHTVLGAELGMYPLKTNKRREKVEMAIQGKEHAKKRLPAKADSAVWEKVTKGRAGIRWDSVFENIWKDIGENQEETLSREKLAGYETEIQERI